MVLEPLVVPLDAWYDREISVRSLLGVGLNFLDDSGLHPIVMCEQDSL